MILVRLEIVDFKQFAGTHEFTPTSDGIIAVIGHNGAGKTSLFEAIEWCLYQPRTIQADDVFPRGRASNPMVRLTLEHPDSGERVTIARRLKASKIADAEIYREDEATTTIVKGSRQVTDYVARNLIGLSHRAFVSTFFTRQKELTFFGDLKETDRRREVGRLLGMETIREAQKLIGEERAELQGHARTLRLQHSEATSERDFAAEAVNAEELISRHEAALTVATERLSTAEAAHAAARAEVARISEIERADAELRTRLERIGGDLNGATARHSAALAALGRIDEAAAQRASLLPTAAALETHRAALSALDLAKERFDQAARLRAERDRATKSLRSCVAELEQIVAANVTRTVAGWTWSKADAAEPVESARRLVAAAEGVDVDAVARHANALIDAGKLAETVTKAETDATRFRALLEKLAMDRATLLASGDPRPRLLAAQAERDHAFGAAERAAARTPPLDAEVAKLSSVLKRLLSREPGALCPECGRPFEDEETAITAGLFTSKIDSIRAEIAQLRAERDAAQQLVNRLDTEIADVTARAKQIDELSVRIETGTLRTEEAERMAAEARATLAAHLANYGLAQPPTSAEIEAASRQYETLRKIAATLPLLRRSATGVREAIAGESEATAALSELGDINYDAAAHDIVRATVRSAESAVARIAQIDELLATRPARDAERIAAALEIEQFETSLRSVMAERDALGFDPAALGAAREIEHQAMTTERASREARGEAQRGVDQATRARDALLTEHARIAKLVERADAAARDADQLDLMYREFNLFEQFVADRLTPALSDYTSELLGAITEGKYDQVWFNSNYGIEVFDGVDEKFPADEFSGGERDLISLCARLALSRLIGAQAKNPPGFMVLDEVFGSLDRERRAQLLDTFGTLAGSADAFRQLFIISHVDDVRSSPIFNEVWRVAEGPDGISHLENLNLTGGFEDA